MEINIIAAIADNMAIGKGNDMPWHISEDLKFFKKTTLGYPIIMGSSTFASLGSRPLPKRTNIVLSTRKELSLPEGVLKASSLEEAYKLAELASREACFVIGGAKVYAQAIGQATTMYLTKVHTSIDDADAFFPDFDSDSWQLVSKSETMTDGQSNLKFKFTTYKRK